MKKVVLPTVILVFVVSISLQGYTWLSGPPQSTKEGDLEELVSASLPGWSVSELPLGETEEVKNAVERILNFDDVLSRVYTNGNMQLTVYIAYWEAGKIPPRMVGNHTPDTCWVLNGWECTERQYSVETRIADQDFKPAEFGVYEIDDNRQHVFFWHVVGDQLQSYRQQKEHDRLAFVKDLRAFGLNQRREQYFIRVASNVPFHEIFSDSGFEKLMTDLHDLTLKPAEPEV